MVWQRAINSTVAALVVVVVILAGSLAFVTATPRTVTSTVTETSIQTIVETSSTSAYCVQTGIHGTLYVRVVADSTDQPISGANVTATITNYCTPNYQTSLGLTNSTGYASGVGWTGDFIVSVVYAGTTYTFPASTTGAVSLVTLSIPSGIAVERDIACSGLGCAVYQPRTTTVTATATTAARTSTTTVKAKSFTYTPTGQVQVDSVWATESPAQNGMQNVTFRVTFTNTGTAPIYAIGGWVNALSSGVAGNSSVLEESQAVRCPGAIYIVTISHGQNYTVFAPDCSTGFNYQLVHPGSISVTLQFNWTTNHQETTPFSNSTMISANFAFP